MKREEIIQAIAEDKLMPFIQPDQLAQIVDFVIENYQQPMPNSTQLVELWHEDKEMLKEKDFRGDQWRLAYNAFLCGFGRGFVVKKQEQPIGGKQTIIISETDGDANIHWDCRSLDDVKALLASAQSFIADKQVEELRGQGSGPDYNTTEGRFRNAHKFKQEQLKPTCNTCGFYENNCPFIRGKLIPYPNKVCKDYIHSAMKVQEQPESELEKAARYVYESWMGGTMDDVRRDMVALGKVLNARKEK